MKTTLYRRRNSIFRKQRENPERRKNLLDLAEASDAFRRRNDELKLAQRERFNYRWDSLPATLIPFTLRERARERIRTIAARMMR